MNMQVRLNPHMADADYRSWPVETLAQRARAAREHAGLRQNQVPGAKQADVSKVENGNIDRPYVLLAMSRAYKCNPHWIDIGAGPPPWDPKHSETALAEPPIEQAFEVFAAALGRIEDKERRARVLSSTGAYAANPKEEIVERDYVIRTLLGESPNLSVDRRSNGTVG